jgi:hypothetical protein
VLEAARLLLHGAAAAGCVVDRRAAGAAAAAGAATPRLVLLPHWTAFGVESDRNNCMSKAVSASKCSCDNDAVQGTVGGPIKGRGRRLYHQQHYNLPANGHCWSYVAWKHAFSPPVPLKCFAGLV